MNKLDEQKRRFEETERKFKKTTNLSPKSEVRIEKIENFNEDI